MVRFTLKQLGYFAAVATHGGIAQAARTLHISQPAVAAGLDKLESLLGFDLLVRHHARGVELTPQGREALVRARWLLQAAEQTGRDLQAIAAERIGTLRFGCFHTLAPFHATALVAAMRDRHPGVGVLVSEGRHDELARALVEHDLDVAMLYAMGLDAARLGWEQVATLTPYVVLPERHPLAARRTVQLTALAEEPYVQFDQPSSRAYFGAVLAAGGIDPPVSFRSQSYEVVRSAVASGLGFSLLLVRPASDLTHGGGCVECRPIEEQVPALDVVVAWPADISPSPLRDDFLRLAHAHFA